MWLLIHSEIKVSKRGPRWKAGWNGHMLSLFVNDLLGNWYKISMNITNHLYFLLADLCCDMESKCVEIYFHQIYLRCNLHSKTYCYLMDLNLNLNLKIVYLTRKNTNMTQYHIEYMTVCFLLLSGDPYKCAERTACVRATHGYYNA